MRIVVLKSQVPNVQEFLKRSGYHFYVDRRAGKDSWVKRLTQNFYPRFHLYVKETRVKGGGPEVYVFDLHIDQKKVSYEGSRAHSGEYEGALVEDELKRIYSKVDAYGRS